MARGKPCFRRGLVIVPRRWLACYTSNEACPAGLDRPVQGDAAKKPPPRCRRPSQPSRT